MNKIISAFLLFIFTSFSGPDAWAISWEQDLAGAFEKANAENKLVMADFYTDWCGWCKKLDKDVYEDAAVNELAEKLICVKVNCEVDKGAFAKYGLRGYPTVIFFTAAGDIEETVVGYRDARVFLDIMNKVIARAPASNVYRQTAAEEPAITNKPTIAQELSPKKQRAAGEFSLAGIMGSKAIVNDKVVGVGDEVDSAKVIAITESRVKLRYKDEDLTLPLR